MPMTKLKPLARLARLGGLAGAIVVVAGLATATGASASTACPGTFHVLHDDHVGRLQLPAGNYTITIVKGSNLSCSRASKLFSRFLQSPSGVLPSPWKVKARTGTFTKGKNGFRVKLA
jgi:hypothetical protein